MCTVAGLFLLLFCGGSSWQEPFCCLLRRSLLCSSFFGCLLRCLLGRRLLCCFFNCQRFTSLLWFWRSSWPELSWLRLFRPSRQYGSSLRRTSCGFFGRSFFGRCLLGRSFLAAAFLAGAFLAALGFGSSVIQRETSLQVRPHRHRKRSVRWRFLLLRPHHPRLRRDLVDFGVTQRCSSPSLIAYILKTSSIHCLQRLALCFIHWRCG